MWKRDAIRQQSRQVAIARSRRARARSAVLFSLPLRDFVQHGKSHRGERIAALNLHYRRLRRPET